MLSKLGFSIATVVNPDILILDHSIGDIRTICQKAIWIEKGKIREIGESNEICDKYLAEAENASSDEIKKQKLK